MQPEANKALVFELADALLKSWWTVVAGVSLGLACAVAFLHYTPKSYEARAKILITPQQIDKRLIQSTVTADPTRELIALEEAVISDTYMRQLVEKIYGLPDSDEELARMIRGIRKRLEIRPTATMQTGWLAFDLVFRSRNGAHAAAVVNTISEVYIAQNRDLRIGEARETVNTLEQRVQETRAEFEQIDRELQAFLTAHSVETEAHMDTNLRLMENSQRDLEHNANEQTLAQERRTQLLQQLEAQAGGQLTAVERLAQLQKELDQLLVTYSEAHPDVTRKRREIDEFRASMNRENAVSSTPAPPDPKLAQLTAEIEKINQSLTVLENQAEGLRRQIAEYDRRIRAVARVQPQLNQLQTRHRTALDRFNRQQENLERARESQFLEESRQAAQLQLAERAEPPSRPVYPVPQRFYALGVIGGLVLFVGPVLAFRFFNPPVSSEAGLKTLTDVPVLVSIPRIETPAYRGYAIRNFAKNFGLAAVCFGALVAVVAFLS